MGHSARIWKFGDNIDTDSLAPGRYMNAPIETLATHCLETVDPDFADDVNPGDILVAGVNFGVGSSREQAVEALKHLGIAAVLAKSFAGIFYRNAVNLGVPVLECEDTDAIADKALATLDVRSGHLRLDGGQVIQCTAIPEFLLAIIEDGGLVPNLENRFRREASQ